MFYISFSKYKLLQRTSKAVFLMQHNTVSLEDVGCSSFINPINPMFCQHSLPFQLKRFTDTSYQRDCRGKQKNTVWEHTMLPRIYRSEQWHQNYRKISFYVTETDNQMINQKGEKTGPKRLLGGKGPQRVFYALSSQITPKYQSQKYNYKEVPR